MDKTTLRKQLLAQRQALPDRPQRAQALHTRLLAHLKQLNISPISLIVGAYWPIQGEWNPLPTLLDWQEDLAPSSPLAVCRTIALPVSDPQTHLLHFRQWTPKTTMKAGAYGIPEPIPDPLHNPEIIPHVLLIPCLGIHPEGFRLGYGGGFYDRTLAAWPGPGRPLTIGLVFAHGYPASFLPEKHDRALDRALSDETETEFLFSVDPS